GEVRPAHLAPRYTPRHQAADQPRYRTTAGVLGLAYALSNAVFSGCAGLIITETMKRTGSVDIPAYYAAATCAVSALALATLPDNRGS
ncbi:hypothetical protein ABZ672_55715, partial [Streptomyces mirabilis]